jgi:hypothetical protein
VEPKAFEQKPHSNIKTHNITLRFPAPWSLLPTLNVAPPHWQQYKKMNFHAVQAQAQ